MAKLKPGARVKYAGHDGELIGRCGKVIKVAGTHMGVAVIEVLWDNKNSSRYHPSVFLKPIDEEENVESIW